MFLNYDLEKYETLQRPDPSGSVIFGTSRLKRGFAAMMKGGVIMDVTTVKEAQIAEEAGAVAVMVLDKLPADIRKHGGVARPASIARIKEILENTTIPAHAKCRIGHTAEARVLEASGVDMVDESEVLTPADDTRHIWKWPFTVPFVNGAKNLGEALRRFEEGASMIRTKGEPGTGNVAEAVKHIRSLMNELTQVKILAMEDNYQELVLKARELHVSVDTVIRTGRLGRLPIVNFAAGGIATPADAAELMALGCDGVFVGSGIFKSEDPLERAKAIVLATTYWDDPEVLVEAQSMIDETKSMYGQDIKTLELRMSQRGGE